MPTKSERLESLVLSGMEALDEFLEGHHWEKLGYDTFVKWWDTKIVSHNIREVLQIRAPIRKEIHKEMAKPDPISSRKLTSREIAGRTGADQKTVVNDLKINTEEPSSKPIMKKTDSKSIMDQADTDWITKEGAKLAAQGMTYDRIGKILGVNESTVRRKPEIRKAREAAEPGTNGSQPHPENTIACGLEPVPDIIKDIEFWTGRVLSKKVYTLGKRDLDKLANILKKALKEIEEY